MEQKQKISPVYLPEEMADVWKYIENWKSSPIDSIFLRILGYPEIAKLIIYYANDGIIFGNTIQDSNYTVKWAIKITPNGVVESNIATLSK